ncbi:MAG: DUF1826 domain-containing protein [Rhizobiales bacterium]|nr:DUF1826 domain-containing protein [Hyphomicrobiales bacterium]
MGQIEAISNIGAAPAAGQQEPTLRGTRSGSRILAAPSAGVLMRWHEPDVAMALWRRSLPSDVASRLDRLTPHELPAFRVAGNPAHITAQFDEAIRGSRLLDDTLARALEVDMAGLVLLFAVATGAEHMEVRCEAVLDDACRRFHVDVTRARLVTTYLGPGTQWVGSAEAPEALWRQERYRGPICEMPRFAVGLFSGSQLREEALVHRSPPIRGTGQFRLFFCISEVGEPLV